MDGRLEPLVERRVHVGMSHPGTSSGESYQPLRRGVRAQDKPVDGTRRLGQRAAKIREVATHTLLSASMSQPNLTDPRATVLAFAAAYTQWEIDMHAASEAFEDPDLQARHAQILTDYCTRRKRAYVDGIAPFSKPPTYYKVVAGSIENVEQVTKTRAHVDTMQLDSQAYRFVVLKKKDGWRIDGVKWRFAPDGDWENTLIGS